VSATIHVEVNGERREVPAGISVRGLCDLLGLAGPVAVERNREIVPRARHAETVLCDGDTLEVVHFVGGG
jgi:sulfur carrier protein